MLAALVLVAAFAPGAAARPATPKHNPTQVVLTTLLAQAPHNFAALRLARVDHDTDFDRYATRPIGAHCKSCKMYDEYARGSYKENWYVEDEFALPSSVVPAKIESLVLSRLRPMLSGFALHRTPVYKGSKYVVLRWRGPNGVWVQARTFVGGYTMRVGHDLAKPVHLLRPPTQAQLRQLADAAANMIRLGAPAAPANFEDLRTGAGTKDAFGDTDYTTSVSFGPMFRTCAISNVANSFGYKDFQPKWVLSCDTVAMAGTAAALKETVRAAVAGALPGGFNATTDSSALLLDDYRWDSQDVSVDVSSTEQNGSVHFTISVYHYLPKESTSGGN
jgi:hypothetical protein